MADIKSAREIAQQKTEALGEATEEERLRWKYIPLGEKLAVKYLNKKLDLAAELAGYQKEAQKYVKKGAGAVLLANINLPKNDTIISKNETAIKGLVKLKADKSAAGAVFDGIKNLFEHYTGQGEQQRQQAYQSLKAEFGSRLQQAVEQQLGSTAGLEINVENLSQFQEEWQRMMAQLDSQYLKLLDEYKQQLKEIN
jgi:hypothetical protein